MAWCRPTGPEVPGVWCRPGLRLGRLGGVDRVGLRKVPRFGWFGSPTMEWGSTKVPPRFRYILAQSYTQRPLLTQKLAMAPRKKEAKCETESLRHHAVRVEHDYSTYITRKFADSKGNMLAGATDRFKAEVLMSKLTGSNSPACHNAGAFVHHVSANAATLGETLAKVEITGKKHLAPDRVQKLQACLAEAEARLGSPGTTSPVTSRRFERRSSTL